MTPIVIGISTALLQITLFEIFKHFKKNSVYALTLSGIGFLYVGFTWMHTPTVIITSIQAIVFLLIAYYGLVKYPYILAAGYFLHGLWDLVYTFCLNTALLPPHYDWFCSSLDFTVGIYLILKVIDKKKLNVQTS